MNAWIGSIWNSHVLSFVGGILLVGFLVLASVLATITVIVLFICFISCILYAMYQQLSQISGAVTLSDKTARHDHTFKEEASQWNSHVTRKVFPSKLLFQPVIGWRCSILFPRPRSVIFLLNFTYVNVGYLRVMDLLRLFDIIFVLFCFSYPKLILDIIC